MNTIEPFATELWSNLDTINTRLGHEIQRLESELRDKKSQREKLKGVLERTVSVRPPPSPPRLSIAERRWKSQWVSVPHAVESVVPDMEGEFDVQLVREEIKRKDKAGGDFLIRVKNQEISMVLLKLRRAGEIELARQGTGPNPHTYRNRMKSEAALP